MSVLEAFCVCDSPYCHHTDSKGQVLPCLHVASGAFYVLGHGEFCKECATNYSILYGTDQVVNPKPPTTVADFIDMPYLVIEGEVELGYLEALASSEPEVSDDGES